jgi:hypothetical protein
MQSGENSSNPPMHSRQLLRLTHGVLGAAQHHTGVDWLVAWVLMTVWVMAAHPLSLLAASPTSYTPACSAPQPLASGARGAPSIILPHQEASYVRHIALDIGGSLIKLVYFSPDPSEDASAAASSASHPKGGEQLLHGAA